MAGVRQPGDRLLRTLFSTSNPIGMYIVQKSKFAFVNDRFEEFTRYSKDELVGSASLSLVHPDDREMVRESAVRMLKGESAFPYEYRYIDKDGETRYVMETVAPITYEGRRAVLGNFMDVTERKRAEKSLHESEEKLRRMFESMTDGVIVTDLNGVIIEINEKIARMHGFDSKDQLLGESAFELIAQGDRERAKNNMRKTMEQDSVGGIEYTLLKADGSEFAGEISASVLKDVSGNPIGFIGITRDISERKRFRDSMEYYHTQITRAEEEERRRIARDLHDETVQSLVTLSLEIQAIASSKPLSNETVHRLKQLQNDTDSILQTIRRFSHELRPEILDQLGLIPALETLIGELVDEKRIGARLKVLGARRRLSAEVEVMLFRIAQEALRNVRKHSQATEVVVRVQFVPEKIELTITDNGKGFEVPELLSDFANKGKLGLIGMSERARLLNSSFTVKSGGRKGTTVSVNTPACPS